MTRFELEEIGIKLKGHQFKIHNEIKKLHDRKHHRHQDIDPLLQVVNYLTPVASPAGSHSTAITEDTQLDIKMRGSPLPAPPISPTSMHSHSKFAIGGLTMSSSNNTNPNTSFRHNFQRHIANPMYLTLNEDNSSTMTRSLQHSSPEHHPHPHSHTQSDVDSLPVPSSHHPDVVSLEHGHHELVQVGKGNNPNDSGVSEGDDDENLHDDDPNRQPSDSRSDSSQESYTTTATATTANTATNYGNHHYRNWTLGHRGTKSCVYGRVQRNIL